MWLSGREGNPAAAANPQIDMKKRFLRLIRSKHWESVRNWITSVRAERAPPWSSAHVDAMSNLKDVK